MQQNQRIILYILLLMGGAAWIVLSSTPRFPSASKSATAPQVGFTAPDFALATPTGETIRLSEQRGNAVLVNLWATWCPPCRAEMPTIEKIYREFKDTGLLVLAINMTYQDDPFALMPFIQEHDLTFPILLDETGEVAAAYQLRSLPSSYFIDAEGIVEEVVIGGPMSESLLRLRIERILE